MDTTAVQESLTGNIKDGILTFIYFVNWLYMVVFVLSAWLINDSTESTNKLTKFMSWFNGVPKAARSFCIGILWMVIFGWGFRYDTRLDVMSLIFSLILAMVIYQYGVKKILEWISKKIGLKF